MKNTTSHTLQTVSFFVLLSIFLILAFLLARPFLKLIFLAMILTILFLPLHDFLVRKLKSKSIAALIIILGILMVLITPIYFVGQTAVQNSINFYGQYREGNVKIDSQLLINRLPEAWQQGALYLISDASKITSSWINNFSLDFKALLANIASFLFSSFIFFLTLFFFLKDNRKIKSYLDKLFSFSGSGETLFVDNVTKAVNGVVKGDFLIALLQGTAATSGFALAGLPQPFFFGLVTVMSSFIPSVGTSLVVVPAIIYLLLFQSLKAALILAVWYVLIHVTIDNVVAPKFLGSRTNVHPLLILFSVIGGVELFGVFGFIFGPVVMSILSSLVDTYIISQKKT